MCVHLQCVETLGFVPLCSGFCKSARAFYCSVTRREIDSIEFWLCEKQHAHTNTEFLHQAILFALLKEVKMAFYKEKNKTPKTSTDQLQII